MADRVIITIGTKKGLFVAEGKKSRGKFNLRGPFGKGVAVYSTLTDTRGRKPVIYASSCNPWFGMKLLRSNDLGKTFAETKSAPAFPKDDGRALANIWALEPLGGKSILAGVEPASLFRSDDGGDSWELVPGISNHPHARKWHPGAGGLCLHTIIPDGEHLHLGISTGGHYLSEDSGKTFEARNQGIGAGFNPDPYPEFGQCVHKIVGHSKAPGRFYLQNHGGDPEKPGIGVLRSDDHGRSWRSIASGLPSDFGFPIVAHPHDPDTVWVVPLEGMTRTCPGGQPAVWRSENGGASWKKLSKGLPRKESFFTVLRDALDVDDYRTPALYLGTTTGQLWLGRDGGAKWECLFDSLPPINNVKVAVA